MACMCGAIDCPSCGRAQGFTVIRRQNANGRYPFVTTDDLIDQEAERFFDEARNGDFGTLTSILGWDSTAVEQESVAMLKALLNRDTAKAFEIAEAMTERVARLYAAEQVMKQATQEQDYDDWRDAA